MLNCNSVSFLFLFETTQKETATWRESEEKQHNLKIAERMFQSSSTIKRGASVTASQRPCSRQLPPERPAAAAATCTNGGGGPPHSPFSHLDLPFLISPHPPAHRSSSQSLLSSTHHPCSPQSPRPLPLLPSPHPPSPRPPLIFHHRPPNSTGMINNGASSPQHLSSSS